MRHDTADDVPARGSVALGVGFQYGSLAFAGFVGLIPLAMWLGSFAFLSEPSGRSSSNGPVWEVLGGATAIVGVILPALVPCLVLRGRQPQGARIEWDEAGITEWDGPWKRNTIGWNRMQIARVEWTLPLKNTRVHFDAIQIFDTESRAVITAWESEPKGAPVVRRRVVAKTLGPLLAALRRHHIPMTRTADWTLAEDAERRRSKWIHVARLGYIGGLIGPLIAFNLPRVGFAIGVASAALLAWRARTVIVELVHVRARLTRDEARAPADRLKLRAIYAEAFARGSFVLLALVASALCAFGTHKPATIVPPPVDVFAMHDSGLRLKGPIPLADGTIAMQHDEKYAALRFGNASLGPNGLFVHLTDTPLECNRWPDNAQLSLTLALGAGPDGKFFTGRVATTYINSTRNYGHVKLEPFAIAPGAHITGRVGFSDPGWHHNGGASTPKRAAGTFDVTLCPFSEADKAALMPPNALTAKAPLAFGIDGASSAPKTVLLTVQYDQYDALPYVSDIEAFEQAGVTCETRYVKSGTDMKVSVGLNPSDLGLDQPLRFSPDGNAAHTQRASHVGWLRIEPFDAMTAKTARGSVVAFASRYDTYEGATTPEHLPPASLTGTFEAHVCRLGSKLGKPYE